jgi:hypothetical protein
MKHTKRGYGALWCPELNWVLGHLAVKNSTKPRTLAGTAAGGGVWLWGRFAPKS